MFWHVVLLTVVFFCGISANNGIKFPWLTQSNFHRPVVTKYLDDTFGGFDDLTTQRDTMSDDQFNEIPTFDYPVKIRKYWALLNSKWNSPQPQDSSIFLSNKRTFPDSKSKSSSGVQYAQLGPPVYQPDDPILDTSLLEKLRKIRTQRQQ